MASPASSYRLPSGSSCSTVSPPTAENQCPTVPTEARAFPGPEELASLDTDDLRRHGFSSTKARTIIAIAHAVVTGRLDLEALQWLEDGAAIERLTSLRGIGRWTAEYVLLRGLGRLHVFPGDDVGAHSKLRHLFGIDTPLDYEAVHRLVARWLPYAGVVYFHLLLDSLPQAGLVDQHCPIPFPSAVAHRRLETWTARAAWSGRPDGQATRSVARPAAQLAGCGQVDR
jgi:HhH-GPD superfamily base excision DNA repair protein